MNRNGEAEILDDGHVCTLREGNECVQSVIRVTDGEVKQRLGQERVRSAERLAASVSKSRWDVSFRTRRVVDGKADENLQGLRFSGFQLVESRLVGQIVRRTEDKNVTRVGTFQGRKDSGMLTYLEVFSRDARVQ